MAALMSKFVFANSPAPRPCAAGFASGGVRAVLRLEGAAAFAVAVAPYAHAGFSWPLFALLFLAPDLAMLAYLIGPRAGAFVYNLAHTYALALPLALAGFFSRLSLGLDARAHMGRPHRPRPHARLRP